MIKWNVISEDLRFHWLNIKCYPTFFSCMCVESNIADHYPLLSSAFSRLWSKDFIAVLWYMYILASACNSEQYRQHGNILNNFRISRKLVRLIKMYVNKTYSNIHVGWMLDATLKSLWSKGRIFPVVITF